MRKSISLAIAAATLVAGMFVAFEAAAAKPVRICIPTLGGGRICWLVPSGAK